MADESQRTVQISLVVAIIGLLGSLIVAYITASSTRSFGLRQSLNEVRQKAYKKFFDGQTVLLSSPNKEDLELANKKIVDAKFSILLVGSKDIVCSMVRYWAARFQYPNCKDGDLRLMDAAIYQAMRTESFESYNLRRPELAPAVIVAFLWSCVLPNSEPASICRAH